MDTKCSIFCLQKPFSYLLLIPNKLSYSYITAF